jgi:hypothetical protein
MKPTWLLLIFTVVAVLILVANSPPRVAEPFRVSGEDFAKIVNAFFEDMGGTPSKKQIDEVKDALDSGEISPEGISDFVKEIASRKVEEKQDAADGTPGDADGDGMPDNLDETDNGTDESELISFGEPKWKFGRLGFTTIVVSYTLAFPADNKAADDGKKEGVMSVEVKAPQRSTFMSGLTVGEVGAQKAVTSNPSRFEYLVPYNSSGSMTFVQSDQQTNFYLVLLYRGESASISVKAPEDVFPPDNSQSDAVAIGETKRVNRRDRIPFKLPGRGKREADEGGDTFRVMWRAPPRTTFFNRVELSGRDDVAESRAVGAQVWDTTLIGKVDQGVIELQQTPGKDGAPGFTVWVQYGDEVTARSVAPDTSVSDAESAGNAPVFPLSVTPIPKLAEDMVDLDAFPFQQKEAIQTKLISTTPRIEWDLVTVEAVSPGARGAFVEVPFFLKFLPGEVPEPTPLKMNFDLDPATTVLREIRHNGKVFAPGKTTTNADTFIADIDVPGPKSQRVVAVFDQPHGRRAFRIDVDYASHRSAILLAGDAAVPKGTGFIGSKRPIDFQGQAQPRFTDVHESAEHRIKALYKRQTGKYPDEQTTHFLMSKYFETQGDMRRVANIVATVTTVAESNDEKALAVQQAIQTMEAGATP